MGLLHAVLGMEKLTLVGNYLNNRMRRASTGDLSPQRRGGELCFGREEVLKKSQRSRGKCCPCALFIYKTPYKIHVETLLCLVC